MTIKPFPKTAFRYLLQECIMPYKWAFLMCLLLVFAETGIHNLVTWLIARLVDSIKSGASPETLRRAVWIIGALVISDIINIFLPKYVLVYRQKHLYFPVQESIYGRALSYIFGHSVNYIVNKQTGTLLAKTNQINSLQPTFSIIITSFWWQICDIVLKIVLLSLINIWLGVLFVLCSAVVAIVNYYANKTSDRLHEMQGKAESLYSGWLVDAISNIRLVKQFNRAEYEKKRLSTLLRQYIKLKTQTTLVWFGSYTGSGCFVHLCSLIMLTFAVYLWSKSRINVGDIVFVLLTLNSGFMWLMELCIHYRRLMNNLAYIQAGLEPFIDKHEIEDVANAKELKVKKGKIEFKNVRRL